MTAGRQTIDVGLLIRLGRYAAVHWRLLAASALLLPLLTAGQLAQPYLVKVAIDRHIATGEVDGLLTIVLLYLAALVGHFSAGALNTYLVTLTGQRVAHDLRRDLFARVQTLEASYLDRTPIGRVMTRVVNDVEALHEFFTSGLVTIVSDLLLLIGIVVAMVLLAPRLALATFALLPPLFVLAWYLRLSLARAYREIRRRLAALNAYLNEILSGITVVHLFRREATDAAEFDERARDLLGAEMSIVRTDSVLSALVELAGSLSVGLIVYHGGGQVVQGALTLGVLVAFIQYIEKFYTPVKDLSAKYTIFQSASAAAEKVFALLDEEPSIDEPDEPIPLGRPAGEIVFDEVSFAYRDGEPVLDRVSFRAPAGSRLGIVGPTGAGKSTIVKLLCRHYEPTGGAIRLDGVPIDRFASRDLRRAIGLVPQDVFLFADTVAGNIGLGHPEIDEARIREAAARVDADRFIEALPDGYRTVLNDRGSNLSAGQRQLLAFARVLAHDPPILVLDEATSSIDHETEALVQQALHRVLEGRTAIVIAHRLSTLREVDRILVVNGGRIVEQGSHEELLDQRGVYWRLSRLQFAASAGA